MPTSTLRIPPDTEQVRVARLVAGTAARRAGVESDEVEDVRLAVGEAVGRAVLRHRDADIQAAVRVEFHDCAQCFSVTVVDESGVHGGGSEFAIAVITGLVPEAKVTDHAVTMTWTV